MTQRLLAAICVTVAGLLVSPRNAGAELPKTLQVGDAKLVLNGTGARNKYFMRMYMAGLYLDKPSSDAAAIVAADAPMVLRLDITSGMVTQERLIESLDEGFDKSTHGKPDAIRKEIDQFRGFLSKTIAKGDVFDLAYTPGQGVAVLKNGKLQGTVAGLPFKQALFGIWLSDSPAEEQLKRGLLSQGKTASGGAK